MVPHAVPLDAGPGRKGRPDPPEGNPPGLDGGGKENPNPGIAHPFRKTRPGCAPPGQCHPRHGPSGTEGPHPPHPPAPSPVPHPRQSRRRHLLQKDGNPYPGTEFLQTGILAHLLLNECPASNGRKGTGKKPHIRGNARPSASLVDSSPPPA